MSKPRKPRYYPFYPDEWLAGTLELSEFERGIYITACALMYSHGGPIEIGLLRKLCPSRGPRFKEALDQLLALGKMSQTGLKLDVKRVSNELQKALKRVSNASQSASKRWKNKETATKVAMRPSNANLNLNQNQKVRKKEVGSKDPPKERSTDDLRVDFERFWSLYPKQAEKPAARSAYAAARKKVDAATIEAAVVRYAASRADQDSHYTKYPQRWLNRECWADDADPPTPREIVDGERSSAAQRDPVQAYSAGSATNGSGADRGSHRPQAGGHGQRPDGWLGGLARAFPELARPRGG
jgi:uncharacterized protein YdaU (DUF1376 family)